MSRQIKDIKDKNTGNLVYTRTHIKAVVVNEDTSLEDLIGTDVGNRLDTLESTIKTDGTGNLYLSDDGSYKEVITEFIETDPTVPAWAKAEHKPTYTASEVGALPSDTKIPTKLSELSNDVGFTENIGTITGIKMNGTNKGTSGIVDLGNVITEHQDISGKLNTLVSGTNIKTINGLSVLGSGDIEVATEALKFENVTASSWTADTTYADFGYVCNLSCSGVTEDMYAEVVFDVAQATSGNYAPVCETGSGIVKIWSSTNNSVTIPVIIITK